MISTRQYGFAAAIAARVGLRAALTGTWLIAATAMTAAQHITTLEERIAGAERVVVARAGAIAAEWRENEHGDRLIVSRIELQVEETLKGVGASTLSLEIEGGTLDGLTLRVSDLPMVEPGERAIFFVNATHRGVHRLYLRGQGILSLDEHQVIRGTTLRLDDVRARARGLGR
jgi:hypothetical protein